MTDFYPQNRGVCSTRSHGPLLYAFCLCFYFNHQRVSLAINANFNTDVTAIFWEMIAHVENYYYKEINHNWKINQSYFNNNLYYNSPYGFCLRTAPHICVAYLWSLQTEFWADRFTTCLKLSPLKYFLYC